MYGEVGVISMNNQMNNQINQSSLSGLNSSQAGVNANKVPDTGTKKLPKAAEKNSKYFD